MYTTAELFKKVKQIEIQTGRLVAETFAGEYKSVFKGSGMEFSEVREYVPGDDVRSIDWNVSARTGKTYIKRFSEERELTVMIACDISASNSAGSADKIKHEAAAELAALFAFSALKNSDRVGLMLFSDKIELYIPPKKGKRHILRIVRELLAFEPKGKGTDISLALNTLNRVIKRKGILVLISDFLAKNYERALKLSARKFDLIPVVIKDNLELSLPNLPIFLDVKDPESGESAMLDLFGYYNKTKALENYKKLFASLGISYISANTNEALEKPLIKFFKQRELRLKR